MGEVEQMTDACRAVDFIYRDTGVLSSLVAQLLPEVVKEVAVYQGSQVGSSSSMGTDVKLVQADTSINSTEKQSIQKTIDPFEKNMLEIVNHIVSRVEDKDLTSIEDGEMIFASGTLFIRNYDTIRSVIPFLLENNMVPLDETGGNRAERRKQGKTQAKFLEGIMKLIPLGLELELRTFDGSRFTGVLQKDYIGISPDDLLRLYGTELPGEWSVLGIVDRSKKSYIQELEHPDSSLQNIVDQYAEAIKITLQSQKIDYVIKPIVIFRNVNI